RLRLAALASIRPRVDPTWRRGCCDTRRGRVRGLLQFGHVWIPRGDPPPGGGSQPDQASFNSATCGSHVETSLLSALTDAPKLVLQFGHVWIPRGDVGGYSGTVGGVKLQFGHVWIPRGDRERRGPKKGVEEVLQF